MFFSRDTSTNTISKFKNLNSDFTNLSTKLSANFCNKLNSKLFSFSHPNPSAKRSDAGMTLIEILIVLALVGGLAAIIGTQIFSRFDTAKVRETKIIMSNVAQSIQLYYTDCGSYPQSLDALMDQGQSDCRSWGPNPYIKDYPKDSWNTDLIYENTGSSFILRSLGKDKREGGTGVDKDISSEEL